MLTLLVCARVPVVPSGTSVILRRLLEHFSPAEMAIVARSVSGMVRREDPVPWPTVRIPALPAGIRGDRYWLVLSALYGLPWALWAVFKYRPRTITAVFPDEGSLLIGYLLHRMTGIPLVAYFADLYLEERQGWQGYLARWLQPRVFRHATRVAVLSGGLADHFRTRYGIDAAEIRHCLNETPLTLPIRSRPDPLVIGYSGNINETRLRLLRDLTAAVGDNPRFEIRYFTPSSAAQVAAFGLMASNVRVGFAASFPKLIAELAQCDVLYLPLEFQPGDCSYDTLATCFATKSFEYFAAARPILVQSRDEFFITRFYRERGCGEVVSDPGAAPLAEALERLRIDEPLRARLAARARAAALEFDGPRIADGVRQMLQQVATA